MDRREFLGGATLAGMAMTLPADILAADVPRALENLKAAVARNPEAPLNPQAEEDSDDARGQSVSLSHRAMPLIDLLEAAAREQKNVMWGD